MQFVDIKNDEGLKAAYQDANRHSWSKEELEAYDYAAMREQDERGKMELVEKRAAKKGKIEMAKQLKELGVATDLIVKSSGLSEDEVRDL